MCFGGPIRGACVHVCARVSEYLYTCQWVRVCLCLCVDAQPCIRLRAWIRSHAGAHVFARCVHACAGSWPGSWPGVGCSSEEAPRSSCYIQVPLVRIWKLKIAMPSPVPAGRGLMGSPAGHPSQAGDLPLGPLPCLPIPALGSHELMQALLSQGREGGWSAEALPTSRQLGTSKA